MSTHAIRRTPRTRYAHATAAVLISLAAIEATADEEAPPLAVSLTDAMTAQVSATASWDDVFVEEVAWHVSKAGQDPQLYASEGLSYGAALPVGGELAFLTPFEFTEAGLFTVDVRVVASAFTRCGAAPVEARTLYGSAVIRIEKGRDGSLRRLAEREFLERTERRVTTHFLQSGKLQTREDFMGHAEPSLAPVHRVHLEPFEAPTPEAVAVAGGNEGI